MPIQKIAWSPGKYRELHVVAGNRSFPIALNVIFLTGASGTNSTGVSASTYLADTANWSDPSNPDSVDVSFVFTPLFKGTFGSGTNAHIFSGSGIEVDTKTGTVKALATLPTPRKNNFIMEAIAFNKSNPSLVFTIFMRVHIHQSITKIWLTPAVLSVRPFTTDNTFSLRAQFDDNTVGDISQMLGVVWMPATNVKPSSGKLNIAPGDNPGSLIEIKAQLTQTLGSLNATAKIKIEQPWDTAHPVNISIAAGGGSATIAKPVNVLFISEGFTSADQTEFTKIANGLLTFVNDPINLPWSKLISAVNFWSVFVPATDRGFSISSEIYTAPKRIGTTTVTIADFLPTAVKPAAGTTVWTIEQLIYMVGLPVQSDGPILPNGSQNTRTNQDILTDWKTLLTNDPTPNVNTALINDWRVLFTRSMIDEVNSVFGVAAGFPTPDSEARIMDFKPGRMTRDVLDHFLESLTNTVTGGVSVNHLWAKPAGSPTLPPDYDLICFLTLGHGRESNQNGYYFVNTMKDFPVVTSVAGTNAFKFNLPAASATFITPNKSRTFIHELSHSFFLDDEYAEHLGPVMATSAEIDIYSNVILKADVLMGTQIDVKKIKWNWHRIKKAAVLSAAITNIGPPANNEFKLTVPPGQGSAFSIGDTVHLRFRKYPSPLPANPQLSDPLEVIAPAPTANTINVKVKTGVTFTYPNIITSANYISVFLPDSIVYAPVDAPASVKTAAYPYAEIIAKNIRDYIENANLPLSKPQPPSPADPIIDTDDPQIPVFTTTTPPLVIPTSFNSVHRPRIVGLYEAGHAFQIGIFHATGNCIMRKSQDPPNPDPLGREFCAVCRYILVDTINPGVHGDIDALYSPSYPIT